MDDVLTFVTKLEAEFEELQPGTLKPETEFRKMESWTSMHALIVIAFIDNEYNVLLKPEEMKNTQTIKDLYDIVASK
jgi:acyl carrier protein